MSLELDRRLAETGTRFRIFPQPRFLTKADGSPLFPEPETIVVAPSPGAVERGPADDRMFVVDAIGKLPYNQFFRPPWTGAARDPVLPGPDGHFDHLDPDTREFSAATMYATVRRVLDIWEDYFGRPIRWHFESDFARLELIPLIEWNNAQSGYGFLEFGFGRSATGTIDHSRPFCENFDVLCHEFGHSVIFAEVGVPASPLDEGIDYGGLHESSGDLAAIVASLHFHSVVDMLLDNTKGNLLTINGLDRVGELSDSRQIRIAFNAMRMSDVGDEPHDRSLPLTGAIFDTMVEVFQQDLVDKKLISDDLRNRSTNLPGTVHDLEQIQTDFTTAYAGNEAAFKESLLLARDYLGRLLATTWATLSPDFLTYHTVLRTLLDADRTLTGGVNAAIIRSCFAWREIAPVPTSMLLRQHTLASCGLDEASAPVAGAGYAAMIPAPRAVTVSHQNLRR
ncbi:hypothetical protein AMIS_33850 [Actinoplanes missouriensis 431]|uniref:Peptidase M4 C-terminal domain-containing protein n=1 Tax=Actinoplanes missouriensis (strain ATCC 14538 / DSM 43046 / CBS 188.64 / JCM 3121 / NBRC 102363 / NCIMB 12654 / NRRL B-3342 / UNCC 431) TaxID=512565 RepID=I0H6G8_ACTM4|nr:hypothetical protein [Actinoplanes missouriensis]BAL88605.1 hypothetical protein AMIS_33850 [Actinoplanes missouriensis 431]